MKVHMGEDGGKVCFPISSQVPLTTQPPFHFARHCLPQPGIARKQFFYSHSIVPGGLLVMSSTQRFTPLTSLMMRVASFSRRS